MGNMQMFYALTQLNSAFFQTSLKSFTALAPCIFRNIEDRHQVVEFRKGVGAYRALGVFAINGPNWSTDLAKICSILDQYACKEAERIAFAGVPISVKNLEY